MRKTERISGCGPRAPPSPPPSPSSPTASSSSSSLEQQHSTIAAQQPLRPESGYGRGPSGPSQTSSPSCTSPIARWKVLSTVQKVGAKTPPKAPEWDPLFKDSDLKQEKMLSHKELLAAERKKKRLLSIVRQEAPMDTIFRLWLLNRTVLPRLGHHPVVWLTILTFGASAGLRRLGYLDELWDPAEEGDSSSGTLVMFLIVFYVGYCYNRNAECFKHTERAMDSISCLVADARVALPPAEALRLWRLLTLMHITGYTGLSPTYGRENLFRSLVDKYELLPPNSPEAIHLEQIDVDAEGDRGYKTCLVWVLELLHAGAHRGDISPPKHAHMAREAHEVGSAFTALYSMQFEALPFIYTHLISLSSFMFLMGTAFVKGMQFTPDAPLASGIVMPTVSILTLAFSTYGLLEVADTIIDPFGNDPEDFPVVSFIETTAVATLNMIHMPTSRTAFDTANDQKLKEEKGRKSAGGGAAAVPNIGVCIPEQQRSGTARPQPSLSSVLAARTKTRSPRDQAHDPNAYSRDRPPDRRVEHRAASKAGASAGGGAQHPSHSQSRSRPAGSRQQTRSHSRGEREQSKSGGSRSATPLPDLVGDATHSSKGVGSRASSPSIRRANKASSLDLGA